VVDQAVREAQIFAANGVDGVLVENFRDKPFYPDRVPPETIAAMSVVVREVVREAKIPVGVNVLRNDSTAGMAIATSAGARFIRVNVHSGAVVADQGLLQGRSHETLRLRAGLRSSVLILADVGVKHATPLADRGLDMEARDVADRGLADGLIVSGHFTGGRTDPRDVDVVRTATALPVIIGSGVTPETLTELLPRAHGFIVGSYFKVDGKADNPVDETRIASFMNLFRSEVSATS
jgi:membrane complex biogenesis BtpA family protein